MRAFAVNCSDVHETAAASMKRIAIVTVVERRVSEAEVGDVATADCLDGTPTGASCRPWRQLCMSLTTTFNPMLKSVDLE
jgi:hypothetical protein